MTEMEIYEVGKSLVRIFEMEWRWLIHTRRGLRVQIRKEALFIGWDKHG